MHKLLVPFINTLTLIFIHKLLEIPVDLPLNIRKRFDIFYKLLQIEIVYNVLWLI